MSIHRFSTALLTTALLTSTPGNCPPAPDLGVVGSPPVSAAAADVQFDTLAQVGGASQAVHIDGRYANVSLGPRLAVLDVTEPESPVLLGQSEALPGVILDMAQAGDYVFAAYQNGPPSEGLSGVAAPNAADRTRPHVVDRLDTGMSVQALALTGQYVLLAERGPLSGALEVVDVSDPGDLRSVALLDTREPVVGLPAKGRFAFLIEWRGRYDTVRTIDVSDPTSPKPLALAGIPNGGPATLLDDLLLVSSASRQATTVVDVLNPLAPRRLAVHLREREWCSGGMAVAGDGPVVHVLDVTALDRPRLLAELRTAGEVLDVAVENGTLCVADWSRADWRSSVRVYDVRDPNQPRNMGALEFSGPASVVMKDHLAYVLDSGHLWVVDLTEPHWPRFIGAAAAPAGPHRMPDPPTTRYSGRLAVAGGIAYVCPQGTDQLHVIDVSDAANPIEVAVATIFSYEYAIPRAVVVTGGYVFALENYYEQARELVVLDVRDPANPVRVANFVEELGPEPHALAAADGRLLIGDAMGVAVVDIGDPEHPRFGSVWHTPGRVQDLIVSDDHVFVSDGEGGLSILRAAPVADPPAATVATLGPEPTQTATREATATDTPSPVVTLTATSAVPTPSPPHPQWSVIYLPLVHRDRGPRTHPMTFTEVAEVGGPSGAVAVTGNYAFLSMGSTVLALDVSDPTAPMEVGVTEPLGDLILDLAIAGDLAYAVGPAGLAVIDIADPAAMRVLHHRPMPDWAFQVSIDGPFAYVAVGDAGLRILDLSDPANPREVGSLLAPGGGWAAAVAAKGDKAYVALRFGFGRSVEAAFWVVDVSDPARPRGIAAIKAGAWDIVLNGHYAYLADGDGDCLRILDVTNPAAPMKAGEFCDMRYLSALAVTGDHAYVTEVRLTVVDVSDPSVPTEVGRTGLNSLGIDVVVQDGLAFVAGDMENGPSPGNERYLQSGDLALVDVSVPSEPRLVGGYDPPRSTYEEGYWGIARSGDYVYVAGMAYHKWGVWVLDASEPKLPRVAGAVHLDFTDQILDLAVHGNHLFVAGDGIGVLDLADPRRPQHIATAPMRGNPAHIAFAGPYALIAEWRGDGLRVFDMSDPAHPVDMGLILEEREIREVVTAGDLAYVIHWVQDDGISLLVADVADPLHPRDLGQVLLSARYPRNVFLAVAGNHVYIVAGNSSYAPDSELHRLLVVDVADPRQPRLVSSLGVLPEGVDTVWWTPTVASVVAGDNLVSVAGYGVTAVDVTDPAQPTVVGRYVAPNHTLSPFIRASSGLLVDGLVYMPYQVDGHSQGLVVLRPEWAWPASGAR